MIVQETFSGKNITSSTLIKTGTGKLGGIWVSSASSTPTIKVWDSTSAAGTIIANTFTPIAGTFHAMPFNFTTGLYITISGTVDCTVAVTD